MTHSELVQAVCKMTGEDSVRQWHSRNRRVVPNEDPKTGIHYGVISQDDVDPEALDAIVTGDRDLLYEAAVEDVKASLRGALSNYGLGDADTVDAAWDAVSDRFGEGYESDNSRYQLKADGYIVELAADGDVWVILSPFYTLCKECSPCAPNAGYLTEAAGDGAAGDGMKSYCLGHDWFETRAPYKVYDVATGELVGGGGSRA